MPRTRVDSGRVATRLLHLDPVLAKVRQQQLAQQQAAVGVGVGAHPPLAPRRQLGDLGDQRPVLVEQLLRAIAAHPLLQLAQVLRVLAHLGQRQLMGAPGALDGQPVDDLRPGPALRGSQDDHRPARPALGAAGARRALDLGDLAERLLERGLEALVNRRRLLAVEGAAGVEATADHERPVAVALEQRDQLGLGDAGEQGRVGDLVAVEVEDRQDGAVGARAEQLVGVPAGRERSGLGLAVADHAGDEQVGIVEGGAVGVGERVAELAALVDRARRLRRRVAGDAAGEGELAEELAQPVLVAADVGVDLAVGALEVGVGDDAGAAMARSGHVDRVRVAGADRPVEMHVEEVEARGGAEVPEQPRLHLLGDQRLAQQRVVEQVDLPDREVVGGAPPGVDHRGALRSESIEGIIDSHSSRRPTPSSTGRWAVLAESDESHVAFWGNVEVRE